MDIFHGDHGPTAVVDASLAGVRLQAYVARTFRESVGRGVGTMHATSKVSAFEIVRAGRVYVNGALAAGRRVLEAGDVVTVAPAAADGAAAATAVADPPARRLEGRSRMALGGATEPQRREAPEAAAAAEAAACRDAFRAYYSQQRLWSAEEWPAVERAFAQPLPLTVRAVLSAATHPDATAALRAIYGDELLEAGLARCARRLQDTPSRPPALSSEDPCTRLAGCQAPTG